METSSPLAAIRPARLFGQGDIFGSNAHFGRDHFGGGAMSLRDQLTVQRANPDYFVKAARGSSPTASLAADLSQNFQINDSSPHFPTPRRALFTTATLIDSMERDYVTTPPTTLASSPCIDMMDITPLPLPHKALFVSQTEMQSPTPTELTDEDMMIDSPLGRQACLEPAKPLVADSRRKAGLRRPSLSRTKGHSTSSVASRLHATADGQPQPFRLGGGDSLFAGQESSPLSPSECFEDSPLQERRPQTANSPCPASSSARPRPHFGSLSGAGGSRNGSPINSHTRRPSNPFMRPRKQFRRSLSMFENPGDMIKTKKEPATPTSLQAVADMEEPHEPILPHFFPEGQNDSIPRITRNTMLNVLDGRFAEHFDQKIIIDCRFEYEYEGGHIDGAINYNDKELLTSHLFQTPMEGRCLLIFHCEYSAHRAPLMARHIRSEDRNVNAECYPHLTYPEIYILEGGYSSFFSDHRERCYPQAYVEMDDAGHVNTCEREMNRLRQGRKGFGRAQTFAFGQQNHAVDESPTAPGRANVREHESPGMMIGASPILGNDRGHTRRMVSF